MSHKLTPAERIAKLEAELASLRKVVAKPMGFVPTVEKVTPELRGKVAAAIEADALRTDKRENGYKWPCYPASKIYYAAKATANGKVDPAGMKDATVIVCARAYGFIK